MKLTLFALLLATAANAQPMTPCAAYAARVIELKERYSETVQARAMNFDGQMIEIFASPSGKWTAVMTTPDGLSCVVAGGFNFMIVAQGEPA